MLGAGKSMLVRALASEMGAQIFNLSPRNTAGQFQGKSNVTKMVHMVFKVARAQGPSIIFIDGVEMVFAKKVPKDDTSDPKRIKKDLLKSMKLIKEPNDKVLVIGVSNKPWDSDVKALMGMFEKIIYCPKPDYSSRMLLWKSFISLKSNQQGEHLDYGILTRSSQGMTAGCIEAICTRVLTERRVKTLAKHKLKLEELLDEIASFPEEDADEEFTEKTPLAKKRAAYLAGPQEDDAEAAKKAQKKK